MMDGRLMIRATIDMKFRTYSAVSHLPVAISRCPPPFLHIRGFTSRVASAPRSPARERSKARKIISVKTFGEMGTQTWTMRKTGLMRMRIRCTARKTECCVLIDTVQYVGTNEEKVSFSWSWKVAQTAKYLRVSETATDMWSIRRCEGGQVMQEGHY